MNKRLVILVGVALAVVLLGAAMVVPALAQEFASTSTPTSIPRTYDGRGWGRGFGFGRGLCGQAGLEAAAGALGMTADELSTQLWGGRTLADLADKASVNLQTVRDAVDAACQAATRDAIEQAVEDGYLSQEQADWLLEGLDKGFLPLQRGLGRGRGFIGGVRSPWGSF